MRRVLAVLAAAAMVAGAFAIRSGLDSNEEEKSRVLRMTCAAELEAACRQLERADDRIEPTIEAAGVTADRLVQFDGDPSDFGMDGWLVSAPWPEIVDGARRARALPALFNPPNDRKVLARSPLVILAWNDRVTALRAFCQTPAVGWKCIGDAAAAPGGWAAIGGRPEWGPVKPGHADPGNDIGLLVLGQEAADWFGRADLSSVDLDDDAFSRWFSALERAVPPSGGSPIGTMLITGPAAYDAVGTTEAEAFPLLARSPRRNSLELLYPSPMATADLVLATPAAEDPAADALRSVVSGPPGTQALTDAGWKAPGTPGAPLPPPGFLDALRARWHSVTNR
ncbi:MAG TPA: hypothetical protein VM121_11790 [Acidimicrobiales bacterium]|nr:hypothetical protein [Acidimicrobiales bacterium]